MAKKGAIGSFMDFFNQLPGLAITIGTFILIGVLMIALTGGIPNFLPDGLRYEKLANGSYNTSAELTSFTNAEATAAETNTLIDDLVDFFTSGIGLMILVLLVVVIGLVIYYVKRSGNNSSMR